MVEGSAIRFPLNDEGGEAEDFACGSATRLEELGKSHHLPQTTVIK